MGEEEDKTTERLGVGRKKSMELKITGYRKIPSILTIVLTCSTVLKLLALVFLVSYEEESDTIQFADFKY
jgi:hypothetical protein